MSWWILFGASLFEIAWVLSMRSSEGFTRLWPSILTVVLSAMSLLLLAIAMKKIPMGTAYAIWTGIGAAGITTIGVLFLSEAKDPLRLVFIFTIVVSVIGLKLTSPSQ
ncbi:MAG TPA: QacE family quaternary ammonium compound efflux SMR transporter [Gammaproteobacteria bacterium]|nr:QacE family quaternary ammonium compound efflux SMR transporter [Gammaproteobacteria bacterium]